MESTNASMEKKEEKKTGKSKLKKKTSINNRFSFSQIWKGSAAIFL